VEAFNPKNPELQYAKVQTLTSWKSTPLDPSSYKKKKSMSNSSHMSRYTTPVTERSAKEGPKYFNLDKAQEKLNLGLSRVPSVTACR
jgi:hypothetical protein